MGVRAAVLALPVVLVGGWLYKQRQYDEVMTKAYVEARVQEELTGRLTPVELDPKKRAALEREREEILDKLRGLQRRRALEAQAEQEERR